jgi:dynein heavy chain
LEEANKQLEVANENAAIVQEKVNMLNSALVKLNAEFKEANDKKSAAVNEAARCARRLDLAQRLVSALGSEKARWAGSIVELD